MINRRCMKEFHECFRRFLVKWTPVQLWSWRCWSLTTHLRKTTTAVIATGILSTARNVITFLNFRSTAETGASNSQPITLQYPEKHALKLSIIILQSANGTSFFVRFEYQRVCRTAEMWKCFYAEDTTYNISRPCTSTGESGWFGLWKDPIFLVSSECLGWVMGS